MKIRLLDFPDQQIGFDHLTSMGVLYWKINMDKWVDEVGAICKERGYKNRDEVFISLGDVKPESQVFTADTKIILTKEKPNLNAMLDKFFEEHLHYDEEIRFILDGQGRFDIRDKEDRWVGCTVEKGDLIIVPENIYHRFSLADGSDFIHAMRLFTESPKWEAIPRPASEEKKATKEAHEDEQRGLKRKEPEPEEKENDKESEKVAGDESKEEVPETSPENKKAKVALAKQ